MQVVPAIAFGGAELMAANLARGLHERGIATTFVSLYDLEDVSAAALFAFQGDVPLETLGKRKGLDARTVLRLRKLIARQRADIVHVHQHAVRYVLAATAGGRRVGVVHTLHTVEGAQRGWVNNFLHAVARRSVVATVAVAQAVADSYVSAGRYEHLAVVPNGIDVRRFRADTAAGAAWRSRLGIDPDALVFACVARFHPLKNHDLLIRAFAVAATDRRGSLLVLAGDGPMKEQAEETARSLGVSSQVRFLGATAEIAEVLQGSDVFVLASRWEGNPLSILEAMAVGLPIVAPAVGGIVDVVRAGTSGLLFAEGDRRGLVEAMVVLHDDADLRARLGLAGRELAVSKFSIGAMVEAYLEVYRGLLDGGHGDQR